MLGPQHPDTLRSMENLAVTYGCRYKYRQAEVLLDFHRQAALNEPE